MPSWVASCLTLDGGDNMRVAPNLVVKPRGTFLLGFRRLSCYSYEACRRSEHLTQEPREDTTSAVRDWLTVRVIGVLHGYYTRVRISIQLSALDMNSHAQWMTAGGDFPVCLVIDLRYLHSDVAAARLSKQPASLQKRLVDNSVLRSGFGGVAYTRYP